MGLYDQTYIMNLALDHLTETAIMNENDDRMPVQFMRRHYDVELEALLRCHDWKFATKRTKLSELAEKPAFDWSHQYPLPSDYIRILPLRDKGGFEHPMVPHELEAFGDQRVILCDVAAPLRFRYIARVSEALFPADFVLAVAARLAMIGAEKITGKTSYYNSLAQISPQLLTVAKSADSLEATQERPQADYWQHARLHDLG